MKLESNDFRLCVEIPIKAKEMKLKYLCLQVMKDVELLELKR